MHWDDGDDAVVRHHGPRGSRACNGQRHRPGRPRAARRPGGRAVRPAVGVVAVGQADGRAVAGDVAGIAFNAQAGTFTAQIAAAEASGRSAGGTGGSVAGRTPALRSARRAAAGETDLTELAGGMPGGHDARPAPAVQGWRPSGGGRGPGPDGPAGRRRSTTKASLTDVLATDGESRYTVCGYTKYFQMARLVKMTWRQNHGRYFP